MQSKTSTAMHNRMFLLVAATTALCLTACYEWPLPWPSRRDVEPACDRSDDTLRVQVAELIPDSNAEFAAVCDAEVEAENQEDGAIIVLTPERIFSQCTYAARVEAEISYRVTARREAHVQVAEVSAAQPDSCDNDPDWTDAVMRFVPGETDATQDDPSDEPSGDPSDEPSVDEEDDGGSD